MSSESMKETLMVTQWKGWAVERNLRAERRVEPDCSREEGLQEFSLQEGGGSVFGWVLFAQLISLNL